MATTTAELGDTIPTIIEEAQFTQEFKAVMRSIAWNIPKGKGSTVNIPYFGQNTSHKLTEGVDLTVDEKMTDTNVQITPYEAGLKIILTDVVIEDDNEALIRAAGNLLGDAYERKRDIDLLERLDLGTQSPCDSTAALTMGQIAAGRAILQGNTATVGPAPVPYAVVIHPFQELDLVDVITPVLPAAGSAMYGTSLSDDIIRTYSIGKLFGMPIVSDGNLAIDTGDDTKGGVFASGRGGGLIYVSAREPNIEPERDASLRGWEMNYVGRYGVGEYLAGWIVELYTDAATPA